MRRRIIPLWLGVTVAVVGGLGPFAGSAGFVVQERRRRGTERSLNAVWSKSQMAVNTTVEVVMPAMGESVSDGTILEWHKQEGDEVAEDETLVEISTDKVDAEVPAPASGTVVKIHVAEGDTVDVGALLAEIAPNGNGPHRPTPRPTPARGSPRPRPPRPRRPRRSRGRRPRPRQTIDITMPAMGESVSEGTVLEWAKQPGDAVEADETIVEISTDKVDAEVPSPASGTLTRDPRRRRRHRLRRPGDRPHDAPARAPPPRPHPPRRPSRPPLRAPPVTRAAPPTARRSRPSPRASPPPTASTSPA